MYQHPIIQHVLNMGWFGEGVSARSKYFTGLSELPLTTIAFILTVVRSTFSCTVRPAL